LRSLASLKLFAETLLLRSFVARNRDSRQARRPGAASSKAPVWRPAATNSKSSSNQNRRAKARPYKINTPLQPKPRH